MKKIQKYMRAKRIAIFVFITLPVFILLTMGCADIERVSVDSQGLQVFGDSLGSSISGNGRFVAFTSYSDDLVVNDTNGERDVFIYDRWNGLTERISIGLNGEEANGGSSDPSISANGRFVVFCSHASNLVPNDNNKALDIFLWDRQAEGVMERVSVSSEGSEADAGSYGLVISANGRFVAFVSDATNLVANDSNDMSDIFLRDLQGYGFTERVSISSEGEEADCYSYGDIAISADGRFVVFNSRARNLVPNDNNQMLDVFVRDRQGAGVTERVNISSEGEEANNGPYSDSYGLSISADGRFVVFISGATNLVPNDNNRVSDVFVRDRQGAGHTERVSIAYSGNETNDFSYSPVISADGQFVVFLSLATNLVPNDNNGTSDIFVWDRQAGITERVSVATNGDEANDGSSGPAISADGRFVTFHSNASNLVHDDTNGGLDVFATPNPFFLHMMSN